MKILVHTQILYAFNEDTGQAATSAILSCGAYTAPP